jgi:hypothetical protein
MPRIFGDQPFRSLSITHAVCNFGDAFFAVSLAGSLFFNVSVGAARPRVIAYLLVTLAPFVVLAPLVGPLIDRFAKSQRIVAAATCLGRGILCLFAAGDVHNLLLYPEVFGILVLDKAYAVTKSALVPGLVVDSADLVAANSRLSRIGTVSTLLSGAVAVSILDAVDAVQVLRVAALFYFAATVLAMRIPPDDPHRLPNPTVERAELRTPTIRLAAGAMSILRGAIGFLVFLVAFGLKRNSEPLWFYGAVATASIAGGLLGTVASPALRARIRREEPLLAIALLVAGAAAAGAALLGARPGDIAAVFAIALAVNVGRQAFDSIVQRDAPSAARGTAFARFETLFQLVWVVGALLAVVLQPRTSEGLVALAIAFAVATAFYVAPLARSPLARRV